MTRALPLLAPLNILLAGIGRQWDAGIIGDVTAVIEFVKLHVVSLFFGNAHERVVGAGFGRRFRRVAGNRRGRVGFDVLQGVQKGRLLSWRFASLFFVQAGEGCIVVGVEVVVVTVHVSGFSG